jgi:hypothetical protein
MKLSEVFEKYPKGTEVKRVLNYTEPERSFTVFRGKVDEKKDGLFWLIDYAEPPVPGLLGLTGRPQDSDGWELL